MKFLAIEKPLSRNPIPGAVLKMEAERVLEYYETGIVEQIFFSEHHDAVLILQSENEAEVRKLLNRLPLVSDGYISFELMSLMPYTGFSRLRS